MIFITNCAYQLCTNVSNTKIKKNCNIQYIKFYSYDPYGLMTKIIRTELYKNKINILDNHINKQKDKYICLHIINALESHITTSVFPDGTEAGYKLVLHVYAKLLISNKNYYPINIQTHRVFIRNSENILFSNTQENNIRKLMYQEIAEKITFYICSQ